VTANLRRSALLPAIAAAAALLLSAVPASAEAPVTAAADSLRTGWYPDEAQLTPQLLEEGGAFGRNFTTPVQGQVYAQPLVSGHTLLAATEDDWIYGIDSQSGEVEWKRSVGIPWNAADIGCEDLTPHVGITGTPVIDPTTDTAYFFAKSYASEEETGPAEWKMHGVDLANGEEEQGFPVTIAGEAQNLAGVTFNPTQQLQRPALLLMDGVVYAGFGSHCDTQPYQGWVVGVSTKGDVKAMWATSESGAAVWQAGGGLVSDGEGQILFATGNSFTEPSLPASADEPPEGHLGDSVVRALVNPDGRLEATEFFSPFNNVELDANDLDLGSGAPIGLPSPYFGTEAVPHLLVQVGKQGVVYLLNRDQLGGMGQGEGGGNADVQEVSIPHGVWGSLATWPGDGGYVYIPSNGALEVLKYGIDGAGAPHLARVATSEGFEFGSGSPLVTSNGTTPGSGIVWISRCSNPPGCDGSTVDAYAAAPAGGVPQLLWSGEIGVSSKFARPDASGGRIYVGTRDGRILGFGATRHTLTVAREGGSGGSVSSDVSGIECGSSCSHSFTDGTRVTLTATPAKHFEFSGWSGPCSGTGACDLIMYSDRIVTAAFAPILHSITVTKSGAGAGLVTSRPAGIYCGTICTSRVDEGGTVTLEAAAGRSAVTWSGCTSATGSICRVEDLEADREVRAAFLPLPQTKITKSKIDRRGRRATFRFRGTASTRRFQCKLRRPKGRHRRKVKASFSTCAPGKTYRHLRRGRYTFEVRAINAAGPDPVPAKRRFRMERPERRSRVRRVG
jgi:Divergent InlB B-repeat domain